MVNFYEPCTDCGHKCGADLRNDEGVCIRCQHRYKDEEYAYRINNALIPDIKLNRLYHMHMNESNRLRMEVVKLKRVEFPYVHPGRPVQYCHPNWSEIAYYQEKHEFHHNVGMACFQIITSGTWTWEED